MKNSYERNFFVSSYFVDANLKLGLYQTIGIFQDMMTEHLTIMNCNGEMLTKENNAFWVVTKLKLHFFSRPNWLSHIKVLTFPTKAQLVRFDRCFMIKDEQDEILAVAKQEMCALDCTTHHIRRISSTLYPLTMECLEMIPLDAYLHLEDDFSEDDFVYEEEVRLVNIDRSKHMNNVEYVRFVMNALNCEDLYQKEIEDFEIHYVNESVEHQHLRVYKKIKRDGFHFLIKEQERIIVKAFLKIKENN